jgi:CDP-diacylglycerol--glycerol-3-phosphate 3-phosphatidyltransferase
MKGRCGVNLANKISITRILLIPFFVGAIIYYSPENDFLRFIALGIFIIGVISDGLDGYIARTRNQKTVLGAYLDPIADKVLLVTAFICLALVSRFPQDYRLPAWVVLAVISRDSIILLGSVIIYIIKGKLEVIPSKLGKVTTFLQMLVVISVLMHFRYSSIIWNLAIIFTVLSGIGYIRRGSILLGENPK